MKPVRLILIISVITIFSSGIKVNKNLRDQHSSITSETDEITTIICELISNWERAKEFTR